MANGAGTAVDVIVTDSPSQIRKNAAEYLAPKLYKHFSRPAIINKMNNIFKDVFIDEIENDRTWQSLSEVSRGSLKAHLGLQYAGSYKSEILSYILSTFNITIYPTLSISGSSEEILLNIKLEGMNPSAYSEMFTLPGASQVTEKGRTLPWLRWLLEEGDRAVIFGWNISFTSPKIAERSRTGLAVMIRRERGTWNVPSKFAGTKDNNFLTKIVDGMKDKLEKPLLEFIANELR